MSQTPSASETGDLRQTESAKPKESLAILLSADELKYLHEAGIGLRHLSSKELAQKELTSGIERGDALALVPFYKMDHQLGGLGAQTIIQFDKMSLQDQSNLSLKFWQAIQKFVEDSIGLDLNLYLQELPDQKPRIPRDSLQQIAQDTCFILGKFAKNRALYDSQLYGGLPKCGKLRTEILLPSQLWQTLIHENWDDLKSILEKIIPNEGITKGSQFDLICELLANLITNQIMLNIQTMRQENF